MKDSDSIMLTLQADLGPLEGQWADAAAVLAVPDSERTFLVDVRTPQVFDSGHIPGTANILVDDLRSRLAELPRDRKFAVYCRVGQRGYLATRILLQKGISAMNAGGGYKTYMVFQPPTV